ncbi:MAG: hypothetical protein H7226_02635 [Salinibacterium sp.]|nr:hypothetical protein [Salinibacterium sp.]
MTAAGAVSFSITNSGTDLNEFYILADDKLRIVGEKENVIPGQTARSLFPTARVSYERIEPTAEAFGDLDPTIDFREVDAVAERRDWTGFHRMEKDLWAPAAGDLNSDGESALLGWAPSTHQQRQEGEAPGVRRRSHRRRAGTV